ncbi:putative ABC transporter ATP-binding protein [Pseudonocardia sp. Ae505_Ps2]|nr:putative ABC transporter ATP-binding protein [Pseudonocardia sp. Ae505_Ps2]
MERSARRAVRLDLLRRHDLHLVTDLQGVEPELRVLRGEPDAARRRGVGAALVEGDAAVLEEHRPRHRGGLAVGHRVLATLVELLLAVHPQGVADRGLLARAADGDRDGPVGDLPVGEQPGALRVEVDTGAGRDGARGARDERLVPEGLGGRGPGDRGADADQRDGRGDQRDDDRGSRPAGAAGGRHGAPVVPACVGGSGGVTPCPRWGRRSGGQWVAPIVRSVVTRAVCGVRSGRPPGRMHAERRFRRQRVSRRVRPVAPRVDPRVGSERDGSTREDSAREEPERADPVERAAEPVREIPVERAAEPVRETPVPVDPVRAVSRRAEPVGVDPVADPVRAVPDVRDRAAVAVPGVPAPRGARVRPPGPSGSYPPGSRPRRCRSRPTASSGPSRWRSTRRPATSSTTSVVTAIAGNALMSGAPAMSRLCAAPPPDGAPMSTATSGTTTASSSGGCTAGRNRLRRRTQDTASTQPSR